MQGVTPLHSAAHNGHAKLARLLIDNGADVNTKTDKGQTPLQIARERNQSETAAVLEEFGGTEG
ncbi:hypothetical protein GF337_00740 [candidate division KSB1 bacterium]|nr:hypothetical protein [candidate division KSB1 bacterium]